MLCFREWSGWGHTTAVALCHPFLLTFFPFSSMGPSHRLQGFKVRPLQCEQSICQVPSRNIHLLWHGALHMLPSRYLLWYTPPRAAGKYVLHHGLSHRLLMNLSSSAWSLSSFSSSTDLGVHRAASHTFFLMLTCGILPFLGVFSYRCHHLG